tara:strand:- start:16280 stop:17353 length:1074 start_codon:yes stop_codon:yes gene_type:complete
VKKILLIFGFVFLLTGCPNNNPTPPLNLIQNWHIHGGDGESEWFVMSALGYEIDKTTPDKEYEMVYFCSPQSLYASFPLQENCTDGPVGSVTYGIPAGTEPNVGQLVLVTKITDTRLWCNFSGHISTVDYNTGPNGGCPVSAVYDIGGHFLLPGSMPEEWYEFVKCSWETSWQDVANSVDTMPNDASCFFFRYDNNDLYIGGETDHLGQDINWYRDPISNDPKGTLYWSDNISPGGGIGKGFPLHYMDDNNGTGPAIHTDLLFFLQETEDQIGFTGNANPPLNAWKIILGYWDTTLLSINLTDCEEVRSVSYELGPLFTLATWSYEGMGWIFQTYPPCPNGWPFDWEISDPDTSIWP